MSTEMDLAGSIAVGNTAKAVAGRMTRSSHMQTISKIRADAP